MADFGVRIGDSALEDIVRAFRKPSSSEAPPPASAPAPAKGAASADTRSYLERLRDEEQRLRERNATEAAAAWGGLAEEVELVALSERANRGDIGARFELALRKREKAEP